MTAKQAARMSAAGCSTMAKAADLLGVSRQTVYNLMTAGKLTSFSVGRRRYIENAELARYAGPKAARALGITTKSRGSSP